MNSLASDMRRYINNIQMMIIPIIYHKKLKKEKKKRKRKLSTPIIIGEWVHFSRSSSHGELFELFSRKYRILLDFLSLSLLEIHFCGSLHKVLVCTIKVSI